MGDIAQQKQAADVGLLRLILLAHVGTKAAGWIISIVPF